MKQQREEEGSSGVGMDSCSTRSQLPWLPIDMVAEILSRLPPKPLLRFRLVCKSWRDTIDSHHFILNLHLPRSRAASPTQLLLQDKSDVFYFDYEPPASTLTQIRLPFSIDKGSSYVWLTSSCNGLLCFLQYDWIKSDYTFRIINPVTGKAVNLSERIYASPLSVWCTCQILWSPPGRDGGGGVYKVLFVYVTVEGVTSLVYTLGLDVAWRPVPNRFKVWEDHISSWECMNYPCINGAAHWVYRSVRKELRGRIAAFDILHEQFREILFPPGCCSPEKNCSRVSRYTPRVVELRGLLALLHTNGEGTLMETWLLTDYSGGVWTKDQTICLLPVYRELRLDMEWRYGSLDVFPAVKISDRELVMKIDTNIPSATFCTSHTKYVTYFFSYDPTLRKTTLLSGVKNERLYIIDCSYDISGPYVESLGEWFIPLPLDKSTGSSYARSLGFTEHVSRHFTWSHMLSIPQRAPLISTVSRRGRAHANMSATPLI
ncbi:putative F-box protein [Nymphaea thermarum]|nr:putative F-box protein [Nymphaea thermarum]